MTTSNPRRAPRTAFCVVLAALMIAVGAAAADPGVAAGTPASHGAPTVRTDSGAVRGEATAGTQAFLGVPYAAPPTGDLRWRAPRPAASWRGVRDATEFGPSCPQPVGVFTPPGPISEDCLYLNVYTPDHGGRHGNRANDHPVLVWIHGGGLTIDGARGYDPTKLAAEGTVVVTINYRLGVLGFLSHPALATRPDGPSGNYGLMDQQAALRWVQRNIRAFGGDPDNVTIAGQSAGGLSVLAHLVAPSSRGLFDRAIVQSGSFALTQQPLGAAEAFGQSVAARAGCPDQSAACLRDLPVDALVNNFPPFAIPGVVDGQVLRESIGTALAGGRFARVPILNGINHDEERLFIPDGAVVSGGTFVPLGVPNVTEENYQQVIETVLGVDDERTAAIIAEYPTSEYPSPLVAFSTLVGDANFACTALQVNRWTSSRVPTFAYELADDAAPPRYRALDPPVATHASELPYLMELPNAPLQGPLSPDQERLAAAMRAAWANFAANGNPSTGAVRWPSFDTRGRGLSLVAPEPRLDTDFASRHHCSFWAAG